MLSLDISLGIRRSGMWGRLGLGTAVRPSCLSFGKCVLRELV